MKNSTMINLSTEQFIDEVKQQVSDAPVLYPTVNWAFDAAKNRGFDVCHISTDQGTNSQTNWTDKAIYLNPNGTPGMARLWDLLHELGHVLQGQPPPGYKPEKTTNSYNRERDAWERGWSEATNASPQLAQFEGAYRAHACKMLQSYRPDPVN